MTDRRASGRQRALPDVVGVAWHVQILAVHVGVRIDLLLRLLLFLLALEIRRQTDSLLVDQTGSNAGLMSVGILIHVGWMECALVAWWTSVEVHTGGCGRVVEVHACGVWVGWVEEAWLDADVALEVLLGGWLRGQGLRDRADRGLGLGSV